MFNRRNIVVGFIGLVLIVAGFFAVAGGPPGARSTPTPVIAKYDFENMITASGTLVPVRRANLAFKISGQTAQIAVKAGDLVKRGDLLVRLEAEELVAAVALAQANLDQLRAGATKEELAAAQANLDSARAQLAKVRAGPSTEDLAIAKASLERAAAALKDAQSAYDRIRDDPAVGMYPQSAALQVASQEYKIAQARYDQVVKGPTAEDIRIAEAAFASAQAAFDRVKTGARPEEISSAQARLDQAKAALAGASLTAPFDGTVAAVHLREGESATPGVPVIALGDLSSMRLETDDLSESSIARVKLGQTVNVAFEALPGKTFKGKVTEIALIATAKQGGTNYAVTVEIGDLDPALRWGMTGHIEINTKQ